MRVSNLQREQTAATRAQATAKEEIANANSIQQQINSKVKTISAKLTVLKSSEMSQALAQFNATGNYPDIVLPDGSSAEIKALRAAFAVRGDAYVWGAAGPSTFDCSGLVVWAYQQVGISLPHYTGSLWNAGMHVAQSDLEPGDLVFFDADISHVGFYIGNGLMLDAPHTGAVVRVEPIAGFGTYEGAVRIS